MATSVKHKIDELAACNGRLEAKVAELEGKLSSLTHEEHARATEAFDAQKRVAALETENAALKKAAEPRPMSDALRLHSTILFELIEYGFTDHADIHTFSREMALRGIVPEGWSIYNLKEVPPDTDTAKHRDETVPSGASGQGQPGGRYVR